MSRVKCTPVEVKWRLYLPVLLASRPTSCIWSPRHNKPLNCTSLPRGVVSPNPGPPATLQHLPLARVPGSPTLLSPARPRQGPLCPVSPRLLLHHVFFNQLNQTNTLYRTFVVEAVCLWISGKIAYVTHFSSEMF